MSDRTQSSIWSKARLVFASAVLDFAGWSKDNSSPNGTLLVIGSQAELTNVVCHLRKYFRYQWTVVEHRGGSSLTHYVAVFSKRQGVYHPQMVSGKPHKISPPGQSQYYQANFKQKLETRWTNLYYPTDLIQIGIKKGDNGETCLASLALLGDYFLRTYSNVGDLVLQVENGPWEVQKASLDRGRRYVQVAAPLGQPTKEIQSRTQSRDRSPKRHPILTAPLKLNCEERTLLLLGDCFKLLPQIPDGVVDLCYSDPPFGTTKATWDTALPWGPLFSQLRRVLKPDGVIVLHCHQKFIYTLLDAAGPHLLAARPWIKNNKTLFHLANKQPLRQVEEILVFTKEPCQRVSLLTEPLSFPVRSGRSFSRTTELAEWFVDRYSRPNDLVLDMCCSDGTSGVACQRLGRRFVGIDIDKGHLRQAGQRLSCPLTE